MQVLQEITDWNTPNHTYWVLNSGKLWAYTPQGQTHKQILTNPMTFDRARRRFKLIESVPDPVSPNSDAHSVQVQGSAGKMYTVTLGEKPSCSCTGFRFRGKCKHIDLAPAQRPNTLAQNV